MGFIDLKMIKDLREIVGGSIDECRKALEEAKGDINVAIEKMREELKKVEEDFKKDIKS